MAASLVEGALLGTLTSALLDHIKEVRAKAKEFKPRLDELESTLKRITPLIQDMEKLSRVLDRPNTDTKTLTDKLEKGKCLVLQCAGVCRWNPYAKRKHANKLIEFDIWLVKLFQIDVTAGIARDCMKILETLSLKVGRGGFYGNGCCSVPGVTEFVVGLKEPVREVKEMVVRGGERVVVVSAPGGCGKTTLAKWVCRDPEIKGMFKDNIFFIIAPKVPSLKVIIEKLSKHRGFEVPEFQTDDEAVDQLERMLIGPNLLVLDDVWPGWELIVENLVARFPEIKVLVTSRSVFPIFKSTYKLKLLSDKDAKALFLRSAFPQDQDERSSVSDDLVNKIMRECGGFPLALEVVGQSLCGQPKEIWKRTLKQWFEGKSIFSFDSNSKILSCLLTSVNSLVDTYKKCYLDLASFPKDRRIPATTLIDVWVGLYNLDEDGEAIVILHELSMRSLVNQVITRIDAGEISVYYNEHFVTQHDLLRELAIHQCSQEHIEKRTKLIIEVEGNGFPKWIEQEQQANCARLVSISTDEWFSSNWHNMHLPVVEVLVLNIRTRNFTLPQFMEKMDQLKVLILTNYGFSSSQIQSLPLLGYLSSLKRIKFEHVFISSISDSILKLRNLQKISFIMCEISEAFHKCTIQIPNMPYLSEIVIDYCNDLVEFPSCLCEIRSLKELSITNCHELVKIADELKKLENLKVLRLRACTKLLKLPETIGSLKNLEFLDISDCIGMSKLPGQMGDLCGLKEIHMRGCGSLFEIPSSVKGLKDLKNVTCDEETVSLWQQFKVSLNDLVIHVHKEEVNLDWLY